jgi:hypothetical protein
MAPVTITLKMRFDQPKKEKNPRRRRPPPIEIKKPVPKPDACQSRHVPSPRSHSEVIKDQAVFPYHIDEENEIIYKMANDGTWTQGVPSGEQGEHSGKLVRWAEVPQTLEFNYDWVLTKIAAETRNVSVEPFMSFS